MSVSKIETQQIAARIRGHVVRMSSKARAPHVASCLSCVDILSVLYFEHCRLNPKDPWAAERDRILLSKGHAAAALYAALAERGYFPVAQLDDFCKEGSYFTEHPSYRKLPGIEITSGSLGHGLGVAAGMAVALKLAKSSSNVYVVLSDGECNEGAIWEAAMWCPKQALSNLTAIVDYNKLQACGSSLEITQLDPLADKWRAFGWEVAEIDGHDHAALRDALRVSSGDRPKAVVAHTVKGKGISFMEDNLEWHYRPPAPEDLERALRELDEEM